MCEFLIEIAGSKGAVVLILVVATGIAALLGWATGFWGTGNPLAGFAPAAVLLLLTVAMRFAC